MPVKATSVTNRRWSRIGRLGVTTSSSPNRTNDARRPSTRTERTDGPAKSRSKRDSACVAVASIRTRPGSVWLGTALG